MMKIQKGIVKYKDRNDIVCTYGVADDGTQYYFLDETGEKKFSNGNRIASTALVEAIDTMAKATHIGVIDKSGNVVIPFDNKAIKTVNKDILIVERALPKSQNVLDAIEKRNDTVAAPTLVSSSAAIKEKMNSRMGSEGRFLINDQFSEATVCDINGENLVRDEYYSYIGIANNELYLCKNSADSDILEFSLDTKTLKDEEKNSEIIDVATTEVNPDTVEVALAEEEDASKELVKNDFVPVGGLVSNDEIKEDEKIENTDKSDSSFVDVMDVLGNTQLDIPPTEHKEVSETTMESIAMPPLVDVEEVARAVGANEEDKEANEPVEETSIEHREEETLEEESVVDQEEKEEIEDQVFVPPMDDIVAASVQVEEEKEVPEEFVPPISEEVLDHKSEEVEEDNSVDLEETNIEEAEVPPVDEVESTEQEMEPVQELVDRDEKVPEDDVAYEEIIEEDKMEEPPLENVVSPVDVASTVDKDNNGILDSDEAIGHSGYEDKVDEFTSNNFDVSGLEGLDDLDSYQAPSSSDTLMSDVVRSMSELMRQNREQKATISQMQSKLETSESQKRMVVERYKEQIARYDSLVSKYRSLDDMTNRMKAKIKSQSKTIDSQNKELKKLKSQLNSKQDLVKLLADAKDLLGEDSYPEDDSFYQRVA